MARSEITVREITSPRNGLNATPATHYDAADASNDHTFTHPGGLCFLYIENNSGSSMVVGITAVATPATKQMAQDLPYTIADGGRLWLPIRYEDGFTSSAGAVEIDIDQDTTSYLAVFKIS